jgi:AcrR family transcriptional regulator
MTPKVPEEYLKFRKDEIITAAWKCFAEKGYQGTTMRDIAKKLNLSTGVIYNYFKNKDEILDALMEWILKSEDQIFDLMAQKNTTSDALLELFNACFENYTQEELKESFKASIYLWVEAIKKKKLKKMVNYQNKQQIDKIASFIREGIKSGEIKTNIDPSSMARFYQAVITGIQVQSVLLEDFNLALYYKEIKKILFQNIWNESKVGKK